MAPDDWSQSASLKSLSRTGEEYNFFQLARLIEGLSSRGEKPITLDFAAHNSLALKPNFVENVEVVEGQDDISVKLSTNGFHLLGQQGPIPHVFAEQIANETQQGRKGAAAFLDIFNDRILRSLYEIKKQFSPLLFNGADTETQLFALFAAASGIDENSAFEQRMPARFTRFWRKYAYLIGNRRVSYSLFKQVLTELLEVDVSIEPATGGWRSLPANHQARLDGTVGLMGNRCLSNRYWSHDNAITITLTYPQLSDFEQHLPGAARHADIVALIAVLSDLLFDVSLELKPNAEHIPRCKLNGAMRLGYSSWLRSTQKPLQSVQPAKCYLGRQRMLAAMQGNAA